MSNTILVGIDVETVNRNDAICEFAAVGIELSSGTRLFTVADLVDPGAVAWDPSVTAVHGISEPDVRGKPQIADLWSTVEQFLGSGYTMRLVAHNAGFDRRALVRAVGETRVPQFECTLELARQMLELPNHQLATVCMALGIPLVNAHRAEDDAAAAAEVARRLELGQTTVSPECLARVTALCNGAPAKPSPRRYGGNDARGKNWEVMRTTETVGNALLGKKVCITGEFACGWSKKDGKQVIVKHGGQPMDNVSRQCDLLVMAGKTGPLRDEDYISAKARTARSLGVRVIGESEFRALVGE